VKEEDVCSERLPGDVEDDMLGRIEQVKRGTTTAVKEDSASKLAALQNWLKITHTTSRRGFIFCRERILKAC
jgi:hypothetical protein